MNGPTKTYTPDFSEMTKSKILDYAEENGVKGIDRAMKKSDLIKAIEDTM